MTVDAAMGNNATAIGPSVRVAILAPEYWKAHMALTNISNRKYPWPSLSRLDTSLFTGVSVTK
jgi:hypothetical protein